MRSSPACHHVLSSVTASLHIEGSPACGMFLFAPKKLRWVGVCKVTPESGPGFEVYNLISSWVM